MLRGLIRKANTRAFASAIKTTMQPIGQAPIPKKESSTSTTLTSPQSSVVLPSSVKQANKVLPKPRTLNSESEFDAITATYAQLPNTRLIDLVIQYRQLMSSFNHCRTPHGSAALKLEGQRIRLEAEIEKLLETLTPEEINARGTGGCTAASYVLYYPEILNKILEKGDVNQFTEEPDHTLAYIAAHDGKCETLISLVKDHGASLAITNSLGYTAAHIAAHAGNLKMFILVNKLMQEQGVVPSSCVRGESISSIIERSWPYNARLINTAMSNFMSLSAEEIAKLTHAEVYQFAVDSQFQELHNALHSKNVNGALLVAKRLSDSGFCPATHPARMINGRTPACIVKADECLSVNIGLLSVLSSKKIKP